jgi:hypothetical protein
MIKLLASYLCFCQNRHLMLMMGPCVAVMGLLFMMRVVMGTVCPPEVLLNC